MWDAGFMIAFAQPCRIRDGVSSNAMRLPMYFVTGDRLIEIADIFQSSITMVFKGVLRKKPAGGLNGANNNRHAVANVSYDLHVIFTGNVCRQEMSRRCCFMFTCDQN